jgi:hypothetical protein
MWLLFDINHPGGQSDDASQGAAEYESRLKAAPFHFGVPASVVAVALLSATAWHVQIRDEVSPLALPLPAIMIETSTPHLLYSTECAETSPYRARRC